MISPVLQRDPQPYVQTYRRRHKGKTFISYPNAQHKGVPLEEALNTRRYKTDKVIRTGGVGKLSLVATPVQSREEYGRCSCL